MGYVEMIVQVSKLKDLNYPIRWSKRWPDFIYNQWNFIIIIIFIQVLQI